MLGKYMQCEMDLFSTRYPSVLGKYMKCEMDLFSTRYPSVFDR